MERLLHELNEGGYCTLDHNMLEVVLPRLGLTTPPETLSPRAADGSWSLSGVYGFGEFPWHTDGAIADLPPRWFSLAALSVSGRTCTELLDPLDETLRMLGRTVLRAVSREGVVSYKPAVLPLPGGRRQLRWDPRSCPPVQEAVTPQVEALRATDRIEWRPGLAVIVDNHRLLHRRPAVHEGTDRVLERRYVWSS